MELAGGDLLAQAQAAALSLSTGDDREDNSLGVMLLSDIQVIFKEKETDRLFSEGLVKALGEIEEAPWGDLRGQPISKQTLAQILRPYKIKPHQIRIGEETRKGYLRSDFADAWTRYAPDPPTPDPPTPETSETSETSETRPSRLSVAAPHG